MKKKKEYGFSLAEALITLLIVCLITIASIPILTKKKRDIDKSGHGKWMCSLNSEGEHVYWSTSAQGGKMDDPDTWTKAGNFCKFVPSHSARNFSITIAGAGGGGASAEKSTKSWTSDFAVSEYGKYRMVAIGSGGGAGRTKCYKEPGGGGAGGVGYLEYDVDDSIVQIKMNAAGVCGLGDYNGCDGFESVISAVYKTSSGNNAEKTLIKATGGRGGGGRWGLPNQCKHGDGNGGAKGSVSSDVGGVKSYYTSNSDGKGSCAYTSVCFGYTSTDQQKELNKLMSPYKVFPESIYADNLYGKGGNSARKDKNEVYPRNAKPGYVMVMTEIYKTGKGGEAGQSASNLFYPKFEAKYLKVNIGKGGAGGITNNNYASNGARGGDTSIYSDKDELLVGKSGGNGGSGVNITQTYKDTPGGNGAITTMFYKSNPKRGVGGLGSYVYSGSETQTNSDIHGLKSKGYGDGGGGGGCSVANGPGNGGDGADGIVIIEW